MPHLRSLALLRSLLVVPLVSLALPACEVGSDQPDGRVQEDEMSAETALVSKMPRYSKVRDAARSRGITNTGYLLAGISNDETGLAHCWSEATWACQGPSTPDCGGGPIIAGSADGPCSDQQGGLGMFQFDAGTFSQTLNKYGTSVLTIDGQIGHAIDYVTNMVKISAYTTNAETDAKARAWVASFDVHNATLRDQWIKTVVRYYNGCQPSWSCWGPRYKTYSDGLWAAINEPGGLGFWAAGGGTSCNGSPAAVGAIDAKYRELGGCASVLGAPITPEYTTPGGVGRYTVFQHGSIYWTPTTGAHAVLGRIRDLWAELAWETGVLGFPLSDELTTPDGIGRYNVFEGGSVYWTPSTDAHEVRGLIRDRWASLGWEAGALGYPISGELAVAGGRRSDFQHGAITWTESTNEITVSMNP